MKVFRKIDAWYRADDISNEMGGGCLIAAFRVVFTIVIIIALLVGFVTGIILN